MRVKIRVIYKAFMRFDVAEGNVVHMRESNEPVALLIDRIYGDSGLFYANLHVLEEWNKRTYQLPLIMSKGLYTRTAKSTSMSQYFDFPYSLQRKDTKGDYILVYPHDGYMDTLTTRSVVVMSGEHSVRKNLGFFYYPADAFRVMLGTPQRSLQMLCYDKARVFGLPIESVYYESASGKVVYKKREEGEEESYITQVLCSGPARRLFYSLRLLFIHKLISTQLGKILKKYNTSTTLHSIGSFLEWTVPLAQDCELKVVTSRRTAEDKFIVVRFFCEAPDGTCYLNLRRAIKVELLEYGIYSLKLLDHEERRVDVPIREEDNFALIDTRKLIEELRQSLPPTVDTRLAKQVGFKVGAYKRLIQRLTKIAD